MPYEFVGESERLAVQDALVADHDGVVERAAADEILFLERLDVAVEAEGPGGRYLLPEDLGGDQSGDVLSAQHRVSVVDREADPETFGGNRNEVGPVGGD